MPAIHVEAATQYAFPRWQATFPPICLNYIKGYKKYCNSDSLRAMFLAHQYENYRNCFHIYTDGSKNNEVAGCACSHHKWT